VAINPEGVVSKENIRSRKNGEKGGEGKAKDAVYKEFPMKSDFVICQVF
jgi:hypothetical protein